MDYIVKKLTTLWKVLKFRYRFYSKCAEAKEKSKYWNLTLMTHGHIWYARIKYENISERIASVFCQLVFLVLVTSW